MDTLLLPPELSIYTAAELHPQWLAWADQRTRHPGEAQADGTAVDQVDGAGVQLLIALQRCLAARGSSLQLLSPSGPLREACAALGLTGWLDSLHTAPDTEAA